jgi:hypothetical protein
MVQKGGLQYSDIMKLPYFTRVPHNPIPLNAGKRALDEGFANIIEQ